MELGLTGGLRYGRWGEVGDLSNEVGVEWGIDLWKMG